MKSKIFITALMVVVIVLVGFMALGSKNVKNNEVVKKSNGIFATIHKSPYCGCCGIYASYMEDLGYEIDLQSIENMEKIKEELEVPYELESCHTTEVAGYVVEGHVPNEAIEKLLNEKPDIRGIGMAGMPSGSPGMPGPKLGQFEIYEINHDGSKGELFMSI